MNCNWYTFSTMGIDSCLSLAEKYFIQDNKCHAYCAWHYEYLLKNPAIGNFSEISEDEYLTNSVLES